VFGGNFQAFSPPDPLHAILANLPPGQLQQRRDPAVSETAILTGERKDRLRQPILVRQLRRLVALRGAPLPHQAAGVPFTHSFVPCVLNGGAAPPGT
jgi:hypothetical protein